MKPTAELSERDHYWKQHHESCQSQGLTLKAYAHKNDIKPSALNSGWRRLRQKGVIPATETRRSPKAVASKFTPVQVIPHKASTGAYITSIKLPNNLCLELSEPLSLSEAIKLCQEVP